ncbi:hypothetical protein KALB_118 [Kutzneria albida DSM 43870]|uniref:SWIM-type domain-containing protein n=2 Tax=Kutzneria TaxID=43356 RepID=W5VYH1_9PSEU|nr:hypothetical protein KALB_118 [Kutzneria albida DSM 43870]
MTSGNTGLSDQTRTVRAMDVEAVLALAPDRQVATGATKLAVPASWHGAGRAEGALWGECAGSGKNPYLVCVDLLDRATRCSCPSRKFPCKHAVALQLLHAREVLPEAARPEWVEQWLTGRRARQTEAARRPAKPTERREQAVRAGISGLHDWLADLADGGLAALPGKETQWWQGIFARMIDAQAPGVAAATAELRSVVAAKRPRWYEEAADHIGRLHLLAVLATGEDEVVRTRIGFTTTEEEVRAGESWSDDWVVLLRADSDDGRVRTVRQWAWGRARAEWVVVAKHAAGGAVPAPALTPGAELAAVLHPYPGGRPRRVAVGEVSGTGPAGPIPLPRTWSAALAEVEPLLVEDPWQRLVPLCCGPVRAARAGDQLVLVDESAYPLRVAWGQPLARALAAGGGAPFDALGLWDGVALQLCAVAEPGGAPEVLL